MYIFVVPDGPTERTTCITLYPDAGLIGRTNKSHEAVPSNCKGGSLAPQCGYLSLHV